MGDNQMSELPEYIDLTPTWMALMPSILSVLESSDSEQVKAPLREELYRLARIVDVIQADLKEKEADES
jgi:hypothetical protein